MPRPAWLNAGIPLVAAVFPIPSPTAADARKVLNRLDPHDVLCHLVAKLAFDSKSQRRAMRDRQRRIIHLICQQSLRVECVGKPDAFVVFRGVKRAAQGVSAM